MDSQTNKLLDVHALHCTVYKVQYVHIYKSSVNWKQAKGEDLYEKLFCDLEAGWF